MKFGKSLSNQIGETLPEWRDKFLSYKELKKRLKLIDPGGGPKRRKLGSAGECAGGAGGEMTWEEAGFMKLLEDELEKFNTFFLEKEEEYIIRLKELQDSVARAKNCNEEMIKIRKDIVDFHGEMVLLENYSALNYTGLVKILKKYEKRTGALIRLPFIQKVLQQPFFTTDLLYKLVKECEAVLERLLLTHDSSTSTEAADNNRNGIIHRRPKELSEMESVESLYMKSAISALRVLKEIRSRSSTVSVFSLPPLQMSGLEEAWNKIPVLEQLAN